MPDGTPYDGCPRHILKRQLAKAKEMGYTMNVGPECEFFLFHKDEHNKATIETNDDGGYFDLAPLDMGGSARRDICLALEEMGFEIEASHHECSAGQHEIDFKYGDALKMADDVMTFKIVVKRIAQDHHRHATFMPKPIYGIAGSGMHINMSLCTEPVSYTHLVSNRIKGNMTSIVLIAEGAGKGEAVANYMRAKAKLDAKAIVLGYIQRGGTPSAADRMRATSMGVRAVQLLEKGIGNRVVGIRDNKIIDEDIDEALSKELIFRKDLYDEFKIMSENM